MHLLVARSSLFAPSDASEDELLRPRNQRAPHHQREVLVGRVFLVCEQAGGYGAALTERHPLHRRCDTSRTRLDGRPRRGRVSSASTTGETTGAANFGVGQLLRSDASRPCATSRRVVRSASIGQRSASSRMPHARRCLISGFEQARNASSVPPIVSSVHSAQFADDAGFARELIARSCFALPMPRPSIMRLETHARLTREPLAGVRVERDELRHGQRREIAADARPRHAIL